MPAQRLLQLLRAAWGENSEPSAVLVDIGYRCASNGTVTAATIQPWCVESWILVSRAEDVPLEVHFIDRVRNVLRSSPNEVDAALLQRFADRNEFLAAELAARRKPDLLIVSEALIELRRNDVLGDGGKTLEEARQLRYQDQDVSACLEEIEARLDAYDFGSLAEWLAELSAAVTRFKEHGSQEYVAALTALQEAGEMVSAGSTLQELQKKLCALHEREKNRRVHIEELRNIASEPALPPPLRESLATLRESWVALRESWAALATRIDHPARWPQAEVAKQLQDDLKHITEFMRRSLNLSQRRPEQIRTLIEGMAHWIPTYVERATENLGAASRKALDTLDELACEILDGWETVDVLTYLGEPILSDQNVAELEAAGDSVPVAQASGPHLGTPVQGDSTSLAPAAPREVDRAVLLSSLRDTFDPRVSDGDAATLAENDDTALSDACRREDWSEVRRLSGALLSLEIAGPHWLTSYEIVHAVSAVFDIGGGNDGRERDAYLMRSGCIAALMAMLEDDSNSYYFLKKHILEQAVCLAIIRGARPNSPVSKNEREQREQLAAILGQLAEASLSDRGYGWLSQVLGEAAILSGPKTQVRGDSRLAVCLWDACTGLQKDVALPRSHLLALAYRMQRDELIRHLAQMYAKPLDHHVVQFLRAVTAAKANPDAWDEARRLAQSFHEQAQKGLAIRPWRRLIEKLNRAPKESETSPLREVRLENGLVTSRRTLLLELVLVPSQYEFPNRLTLTLGSDDDGDSPPATAHELIDNEPLTRRTVRRLEVPLSEAQYALESIVLPYRVTGRSTQDRDIDLRGRWSFTKQQMSAEPLQVGLLDRCWPGASGDPLDSSSKAFHGRTKEKARLTPLLSGSSGRQQSAVVVGQRRIGKTSLLIEMLQEYPPDPGHVCGVYLNLGGISKRHPDEPLAEAVFRCITNLEGDPGGYNRRLCEMLRETRGAQWNEQFQKGLDPGTSIATAITRFVERITEATRGTVQRMAFFIDEFQAVFRFPGPDVDTLMWSLRPIVQQSNHISLVLAGSGLTRQLIRGYDKAFFGSIAEITLQPFSIDTERIPIADTFLPALVRERLCPRDRDFELLVDRAYELSGGHPWYLAMLGYYAAKLLEGRPVTPDLLNQVANDMVRGNVAAQDRETAADRFYGHLLDSFDAIPRAKAVAQLSLANIARQVTLEWPWITVDQAINWPRLADLPVRERERHDALRMLRDEDVLEYRHEASGWPRCRIRIPLLAEAIRFDADEIEYKAVSELKAMA